MYRLLVLSLLTACGPLIAGSNDTVPELQGSVERADLLWETYSFGSSRVAAVATNDREVFATTTDQRSILIFSLQSAIDGEASTPGHVLAAADIPGNDYARFSDSIDARDDLLSSGPFVYRRTGSGWQFEAEVGADTAFDGSTSTTLLGRGQLARMDGETLYVFENDGTRWRDVQRFDIESNAIWADHGDLFIAREQGASYSVGVLYGRGADGRWARLTTTDRSIWATHNNYALDNSGRLLQWDGTTLEETTVDFDFSDMSLGTSYQRNGLLGAMIADRITLLTEDYTAVYDLDGTLIGMNDEQPLRLNSHAASFGVTSIADPGYRQWTVLQEPVLEAVDPDNSFTQIHNLEITSGEEIRFSFDIAERTEELTVALSGTGDADLYVRFGEEPQLDTFDCAPYRLGSEEYCSFVGPTGFRVEEGTWHAMVVGYAPSSEVEVVVNAIDLED